MESEFKIYLLGKHIAVPPSTSDCEGHLATNQAYLTTKCGLNSMFEVLPATVEPPGITWDSGSDCFRSGERPSSRTMTEVDSSLRMDRLLEDDDPTHTCPKLIALCDTVTKASWGTDNSAVQCFTSSAVTGFSLNFFGVSLFSSVGSLVRARP